MTAFFHDLNDYEKTVQVRVGKPVPTIVKDSFSEPEGFSRFLRAKLYALGSPLDVSSFFNNRRRKHKDDIANPAGLAIDAHLIENELEQLPESLTVLVQGDYTVFFVPTTAIPLTIKEIGRLREVTFRAVGEGTGKAYDLDEYDVYYHQLVLLNHAEKACCWWLQNWTWRSDSETPW